MLYRYKLVIVQLFIVFFFNDTATTEIYTLSLHDALPISGWSPSTTPCRTARCSAGCCAAWSCSTAGTGCRSEEHTSELQSHVNLVCRLLLEKKKKTKTQRHITNNNNIRNIQFVVAIASR